jgi:hypothetical protein
MGVASRYFLLFGTSVTLNKFSFVRRAVAFLEAHTKSVAPQHPKAREAAGILQPDWEGR